MTVSTHRLADLYIAVDLSDSDESLADIAQQCGYDVMHPTVLDVAEPSIAQWHEQPCLCIRLTLSAVTDGLPELSNLICRLSHPAIASYHALTLLEVVG